MAAINCFNFHFCTQFAISSEGGVDSRVNRMTQQDRRKLRALHERVAGESDLNRLLDIILALDRMVVELSMRAYNLPRRERFTMREQNRRLHDAVRERLPRLTGPSGDTV
jgi:hypothetical protein